ncbi:MAG: hypothetical protein E6Q98_25865 [Rhodospirillaceae bacterium]|nr:MAG: hypothetical protein E6Q98_25865 [Rhodospirillaceae bacterium]
MPAAAVEPKDTSYFCVVEIAGGLMYDDTQKRWRGGALRTDEKFVLKLKYLNSQMKKNFINKDELILSFNVSITQSGTSTPRDCYSRDWTPIVEIGPGNHIFCNARVIMHNAKHTNCHQKLFLLY